MSHPDAGVLQEFLDGELGPQEAEALTAHMAACAACSTRLDAMRTTMLEADGLVERLQPGEASRRYAMPTARRRKFSTQHMGIAAGLLVAVTAGLLWESERRQLGKTQSVEPASTPRPADEALARQEVGPTLRPGGDTFRLRAGGQAAADAEQTARHPVAARTADQAEAVESGRRAAESPAPAPSVPAAGVAEARVPTMGAIRQEPLVADTPPSAATPPPPFKGKMKIEGNLPMPVPRTLGSTVTVVLRRLEGLERIRLDTLPGTFRSTYRVGGEVVVLEESARALPGDTREEAADAAANHDGAEYRWEVRGAWLRLSGPLTRDSLVALSRLVR